MDEFAKAVNEVQNAEFVGNEVQDNTIEFLKNAKEALVTFSQGRYVSKIKKLAEEYPNECRITHENTDGSIVAIVPTKWVKVSPPRSISDEQKEKSAERFRALWEQKRSMSKT